MREIVDKRQAEKDVDGSLVKGDAKLMLSERKRLYLDDKEILRRRSDLHAQIVLPKSMQHLIYQQLHVEFGHLEVERVYQLAKQRVYWLTMLADIDDFIHKCCRCLTQKPIYIKPIAPLQSIITSSPMALVAFDFLHLEKSSGSHEYLLLIVDHFTLRSGLRHKKQGGSHCCQAFVWRLCVEVWVAEPHPS